MSGRRENVPLDRPVATTGRVGLYFAVRYCMPLMVLLAVSASAQRPSSQRLTAILTAQVAFAVASHALATRGARALGLAIWTGMMVDVVAISALVAMTDGPGGPLVFLYTVEALAAGILLSSRAGLRMLLLSTIAIVVVDVGMSRGLIGEAGQTLPQGLEAVAALWILGGGGTLFSTYNERELRRRNAELATIRQVTLDIEDSLTIEEIFHDLCRGVVDGFGFDAAAVLLRNPAGMTCVGAQGITGALDSTIELRGRLAHALAMAGPVVTSSEQARTDGALIPLIGPRGYLAVPIAEDGLLIATRAGRKRRSATIRQHEIDALARLAHHARLAVANARLHARVSEMAITDPLTGLVNHGEMQRRLAYEVGRIQRYSSLRGAGHRTSLVLVDIDFFKKLNDRFGHQAGDAVLKGVAAALRGAVRSFDVVARYGGEEFAVILPDTDAESSREVAERLRKAVAEYPFAAREGSKPVRVTVSVGAATAPDSGATPAALIKAADSALYRSKETGRNRVEHAADYEEPVALVVPMDATRRRQARGEGRAHAAGRRAPARSSLPRRRTPRA